MELSTRETWAVIHRLVLGTLYLLAFGGALAGLWSLRPGLITSAGVKERMKRLYLGFGAMAVVAWLTVITGTWIVYPWYRAKLASADFAECAGLNLPSRACSPRDFLLSNASGDTTEWRHFGMEWKGTSPGQPRSWPGRRSCWSSITGRDSRPAGGSAWPSS